MGDVAVLFRIYTVEGGIDKVKAEIVKLKPRGLQIEDVAFGIKTIKVLFIHPDSQGSSGIEDEIRKIPGVNEVEVLEETLV
jgi:translation elongation factor EF-1beta